MNKKYSKIQAFPGNVLVRKISLKRLKNLQKFKIPPVLSMLFEKLLSKQIVDFFERILSKCQCGFYSRKGYDSQHCLQMMLET